MKTMTRKASRRVQNMTGRELVIVAVAIVLPGGLVLSGVLAKVWKA